MAVIDGTFMLASRFWTSVISGIYIWSCLYAVCLPVLGFLLPLSFLGWCCGCVLPDGEFSCIGLGVAILVIW